MAAKKAKSGKKETKTIEKRAVPEYKIKIVADLAKLMKSSSSILVASTKNLPSSQFHAIKKNLRGKAEIRVAKKTAVLKAIEMSEKGALQNLKVHIVSDVALFFSSLDPFELSALLTENESPAKAKAGDIAPEDIVVEPGPTTLIPGPAISELSGAGLKVAVEGGKLAIKIGATVARKGEPIKENVASVLAKLDVLPMKVGFEPIAAYDSKADKIYTGIKIDKKKTLEQVRTDISKALGFAINLKILVKETLTYFLAKANMEEKAIESLVNKGNTQTQENTQINTQEVKQ